MSTSSIPQSLPTRSCFLPQQEESEITHAENNPSASNRPQHASTTRVSCSPPPAAAAAAVRTTPVVAITDVAQDKVLFRCESDHPKVLIGLLMSFGHSSAYTGNGGGGRGSNNRMTNASQAQAFTDNTSNHNSNNIGQMTIYATESGLQFHQSSNASSQSSMELPKELFSFYRVEEEDDDDDENEEYTKTNSCCCCCVSWKPLRNALTLIASQTPSKLSLIYNRTEEVLHVEGTTTSNGSTNTGLLCTCLLGGMVPPEESPQLSQAFLEHDIVARVLVPSSILLDITELALVSPMAIQLQWKTISATATSTTTTSTTTTAAAAMNTEDNLLQVTAVGPCSECSIQWNVGIDWNTSMDMTTEQQQPHSIIQHSYPFHAWAQAMKPLLDSQLAHETCISVNAHGILAIQHQLLCHDNIAAFCDGLLLPLIMDDDDDDDDDDDTTTNDSRNPNWSQNDTSQSQQDNHAPPPYSSSQSTLATERSNHYHHCTPHDTVLQRQQQDDDTTTTATTAAAAAAMPEASSYFGSLSMEAPSQQQQQLESSLSYKRRRQRKQQRARRLSANDDNDDTSSSAILSPVPLLPSNSPPSDNEEEQQQQRQQDSGDDDERYCSSPEVVYGTM